MEQLFDHAFFGLIANQRVVYKYDLDAAFVPNGLTIDRWGNLYTCVFGGGYIIKLNPL